jgi:glyoxylase-like metal-dependent hydrolase (beta-lactamase superfamily II)
VTGPVTSSSATNDAATIILGDVEVLRVLEWAGAVSTVGQLLPDSSPTGRSRLGPEFRDPGNDALLGVMQTWVLRSEGRTILVDTGAGNDRDRPLSPLFDHLSGPFLDNLAAAGIAPEDVDVVVNTHLHYDHIGWNTRLVDGQWVPTFPNATYLMSRADHDRFDPAAEEHRGPATTDGERRRRHGNALAFADSIAPVVAAGRVELWEDTYAIDANLTLEAAPGHTPGSAVLRLASGSDRAMFVGDILHSPVQIAEPTVNSCFCEDPAQARATRGRLLDEAADTRTLVVPAHFAGHGAAEIRRSAPGGDAYQVARWAAFPPL